MGFNRHGLPWIHSVLHNREKQTKPDRIETKIMSRTSFYYDCFKLHLQTPLRCFYHSQFLFISLFHPQTRIRNIFGYFDFFFLVLFFSRQIEGCNRWKWLLFSIWRGNHQNLGSIWINHYQGHCMSSWCWWKKLPSSEGKLYVDIPLKCHLNELTGDPRLLVLNICETLFINGVCLNWFRNNFPFESFSLLLVVLPSGISFNPLASNL